jgi:hypothetical protein
MTYDCKRNGTIDLFAAMNLATGEVPPSIAPLNPTSHH